MATWTRIKTRSLTQREPVLASGGITGAVFALASAVLALLVSFGVPLTETQVGAILAVVTAVAGVVSLVWARSKVTPTNNLPQ